nr:MAG TPA: hypothetical protein [Caudoviricetes sp.]
MEYGRSRKARFPLARGVPLCSSPVRFRSLEIGRYAGVTSGSARSKAPSDFATRLAISFYLLLLLPKSHGQKF